MSENNILGVILAGGKSKRFGNDKTIAKLGNKTLLDHTIEKIEKNFNEILIVSNIEKIDIKKKNIFSTKDLIEGYLGPLVGVGAGVCLMIILNVTHPPAGGNPIIVIIGSVSIDYLINPIITGTIIILIFGIILNRLILKKKYPI